MKLSVQHRLSIILGLFVVFFLVATLGLFQVSKGARFHQLNSLHLKYSSELGDLVLKSTGAIPDMERVTQTVLNIRSQPEECLVLINPFDRFVMDLIGTAAAIKLCKADVALADRTLESIRSYEAGAIRANQIQDILRGAAKRFTFHSSRFEKPIGDTVDFMVTATIATMFIIGFFFMALVVTVLRSISRTVVDMQKTAKDLEESEERFRIIVEQAGDAVFIIEPLSGKFVDVNKRACTVLGYTRDELLSLSIPEIDPSYQQEKYSNFIDGLSDGATERVEGIHRRKDGSTYPVEIMTGFIELRGRKLILAFSRDISARMKAEKALRISEALFRAVVNHSPTKIHIKDIEGRYILINKEAEKLFGVTSKEIQGKTTYDLFPKDIADVFMDHDRTVIESGEAVETEEAFTLDDGVHTYLTTKFPIFDQDGITGIGAIGTDITNRLKVENELKASKEAAEKANNAKSYFLAHMSHELRTPLNSIIGFSQTIMEGFNGKVDSDKYLEYIEDIYNSGHHLLHLINDVLDISKIEAGKFTLKEEKVDLNELLNSCLRVVRGKKEAESILMRYEPSNNLPNIWADERLVKQIVLNLLSNAVKYNVANGTVCLSVGVNQDDAVSVVVSDTGVGIATENIPKVLEPFGQARSDAQKAHEGTGLGLSLSKQLVELHGGTLELESALGKGTTVSVMFPSERTIRS